MPEQPTAAQLPAAPAEWQQILNTAYALVDGDKRDAIGEQICEAYSFGVAAGVQLAQAEADRLAAELATLKRHASHLFDGVDAAYNFANKLDADCCGTYAQQLRDAIGKAGTAPVPGSSRRAPEAESTGVHAWAETAWGSAPAMTACTRCGIVQRRDGENGPCKGPGRVELRAPEPAALDVEELSAAVHEGWMESKRRFGITSRKSESGEELMVPYSQLSEMAKQLDRDTVRSVLVGVERVGYVVTRTSAGESQASDPAEYLIWSHHHKTWFAPNGCGYRSQITDAGRFTLDATKQWLGRGCGCCPVPEVVIPAPGSDVLLIPGRTSQWASEQIEAATNARIGGGQVNSWAAGESQASEPAPAAPKLAQGGIVRPVDLVDLVDRTVTVHLPAEDMTR